MRVVYQPDHLVVTGLARADLLIARVARMAIAITRFNVLDAFDLDIDWFGALEAAAP